MHLGLSLGFLLLFFPRLRSDALHYYELPRSVVIDGDLNGAGERTAFTEPLWSGGQPRRSRVGLLGFMAHPEYTRRGYRFPFFPVGYPLLLLPPTAAVQGAARLMPGVFLPEQPNGYELPFRLAAGYWTVLAGALAAGLCLRLAWRLYPGTPAVAALLLILLGTNLPAFLFVDPVHSHGFDFLVVTLVIALWLRGRDHPSGWNDLALGLLCGFAALFRYQDVFLLGIPLLDCLLDTRQGVAGRRRALRRLSLTLLGFGLAALPQSALWRVYHGHWLPGPGLTGTGGIPTFNPLRPRLLQVLLSNGHGLLTWTPLMLPALLGLPLVLKRHRLLGAHLLWTMALQLYYDSCRSEWWNLGFGVRRTAGFSLIFVLGLAALMTGIRRRRSLTALVLALGVLLVVWNFLFLTQFYQGATLQQSGSYYHRIIGDWAPYGAITLGLPLPSPTDLPGILREAGGFLHHRTLLGHLVASGGRARGLPGALAGLVGPILLALLLAPMVQWAARGRAGSIRSWALAGIVAFPLTALGVLVLDARALPVLILEPGGTPAAVAPLGPRAMIPVAREPRQIPPEGLDLPVPPGRFRLLHLALEIPAPPTQPGRILIRLQPSGQTFALDGSTLGAEPTVPADPGVRIRLRKEGPGRRVELELDGPLERIRLESTLGETFLWGVGLAPTDEAG